MSGFTACISSQFLDPSSDPWVFEVHCEAVQTFLESSDNTNSGDAQFRMEHFPAAILLGLVSKFSKECGDDEEFLKKMLPVRAALYAENAEDFFG